MHNEIRSLSDSELLSRTAHFASEERRITCLLIEHLREVFRRKLYADLGRKSLFQYCIKDLKLSEASAQRRIDAMFLTEELPEVAPKLKTGEMTLSVASRLQTFIRQEEKSAPVTMEKKQELVATVEGKSVRDAERELFRHTSAPEKHCVERARPVGDTQTQITFTATEEQMALFEQARAQLAHSHPQLTWAELFTVLAEKLLRKPTPRRDVSPAVENRRRPSQPLRRAVLDRDHNKCVNCGSIRAIQADHIQSWAKGGKTEFTNLQSLCRSCHQRKTIREFGVRS